MIFDEFQLGILNALNGDAYFSQAPSVLIVPEEALLPNTTGMDDAARDAALEAAREDHRKQVQNALNTNGIVGVVSEVEYEAGESRNMFTVRCSIAWFENRRKNTRASARNCSAKAHVILQRFVIPIFYTPPTTGVAERFDPFSPILIKSSNYVGDEDGTIIREMVLESSIAIEALSLALINESGFTLVDGSGNNLIAEPSAP